MKTIKQMLITVAVLLCSATASAHDFEVDGIYYNILTTTEVGVTFRGSSSSSYYDEYAGKEDIPESVTYNGNAYSVISIGEFAFYRCYGLTSITIPNSVTSIGNSAFEGCSGLTSITIPNSVTSIGQFAFGSCAGLASIVIPNSVTSIERYAFYRCTGLTSITIPNSVTSIGERAFYGCNSLSEIYSNMENPCACPPYSDGSPTLYVPAGTADKYIAQGWDEWVSEIVEVKIEMSNKLAVSDVKVTHGASVILPVSMENEESVTAFQFEVSLPEGVSLVGCELTDRKSDQTLSFSELPNGNYQVVALSLTSKAFKDSEGVLVNLQLSTDKEMAVGSYEMGICNIELTTTAAEVLTQEDFTATLSVIDVEIGDTNGDGRISITDAVAIVNKILGNPSANYVEEASDVNGDGRTSITDAVAIVNKILSGESEAKDRMARKADLLDPQ